MNHGLTFGRRPRGSEPPIEMRFVDLFMIFITTLMFVAVMLSIISAFVGGGRVDVAPRIATTRLPTALAEREYSLTIAGVGGASPYLWRVVEGKLPEGVNLDPGSGVISGRPVRPGLHQITVELSDVERRTDRKQLLVDVASAVPDTTPKKIPLRVASPLIALPDAVQDEPYSHSLAAESGIPPYAWSIAEGELPGGLNLTPSGELVGTPTLTGSEFSTVVRVTDGTGLSIDQEVRLVVKQGTTAWWKRVLDWVWRWIPWGFGALFLVIIGCIILFGVPPQPETPGIEGVLSKLIGKNR